MRSPVDDISPERNGILEQRVPRQRRTGKTRNAANGRGGKRCDSSEIAANISVRWFSLIG